MLTRKTALTDVVATNFHRGHRVDQPCQSLLNMKRILCPFVGIITVAVVVKADHFASFLAAAATRQPGYHHRSVGPDRL